MTTAGGVQIAADKSFVARLEAANLHPLWDRFRTLTPVVPAAKDPPLLWRWKDIERHAEEAVAQVAIDDVERRALILVNPAFDGQTVTTSNLIGAFTILDPGDRARPHRHTFAAIRFATQADGAATIVNGRRCAMAESDLILTPPMCWHGHINESDRRIVWFDAANIPLIRTLDANFFEPWNPSALVPGRQPTAALAPAPERQSEDFWQVDEGDERIWAEAGMAGDLSGPPPINSPKYHYSGAAMRRMLSALPTGADGARTMRYTNPATGGPVMPALDCAAMRLPRGQATRPRRTTANVICLVASGEGRSTIGEHSFEWSRHDVFSIPHWTVASHQAKGSDADIFMVSDRSAMERLDLYREELS